MKSKLYSDIWGVRHQSFFMDTKGRPKNMRPLVPIIPVRPTHGTNIWIHDQHDTDRDGVPNYRDCQPFNPNKQDYDLRRIESERYMREKIRRDKMSRRLNVRSTVRSVSRSRIDDSRKNNRYDITKRGNPQNYKNQRYREV